MEQEDSRKITPDPQKELTTRVVIGAKRYLVLTEDYGFEKHLIITQAYLGGKIVSTKKTDYNNILSAPEPVTRIIELMQDQHEDAITVLRAEHMKGTNLTDYLDEIRKLIQRKNHKAASTMLTIAFDHFPGDPFLFSYRGYLEAILNKNYKQGIDICLGALKELKGNIPEGLELLYPVLYLNLGKTYLAAGYKKAAMDVFYKGLAYDHEDRDLLREIKKFGARKKPVVGFLPRTHPINKYLGKLRHKIKSP